MSKFFPIGHSPAIKANILIYPGIGSDIGADAIERATLLGWELVVKKDEFRVGDLCVYCEIDSNLPDRPEFEFLKPRGMRIKTIRLCGQTVRFFNLFDIDRYS